MPGAARTPAAVALVLICAFGALRSHDQEQARIHAQNAELKLTVAEEALAEMRKAAARAQDEAKDARREVDTQRAAAKRAEADAGAAAGARLAQLQGEKAAAEAAQKRAEDDTARLRNIEHLRLTGAKARDAGAALAKPDARAGSDCEQGAGDLRTGLDSSRVYQRGPTMVYVHDSFLNESEVAHLRGRGKRALMSQLHRRPQGTYETVSLDGPKAAKQDVHDPVFALIRQRVARLTRIPIDPSPVDVQSVTMYAEISGHGLMNVHHDRNKADRRVATVITYLSDTEGQGATIFPCIGEEGGPPAEEDEVCKKLIKLYEEAATPSHSITEGELFDRIKRWCDAPPLRSCPEEDCPKGLGMLRVEPRPGRAAVFPSATVEGGPDTATWHAGCPVDEEHRKVTVQFFRAPPERKGDPHPQGWRDWPPPGGR